MPNDDMWTLIRKLELIVNTHSTILRVGTALIVSFLGILGWIVWQKMDSIDESLVKSNETHEELRVIEYRMSKQDEFNEALTDSEMEERNKEFERAREIDRQFAELSARIR